MTVSAQFLLEPVRAEAEGPAALLDDAPDGPAHAVGAFAEISTDTSTSAPAG